MKKLICILLAICCLGSLALAEEANPFAPYTLSIPEGAALEESEGTYTIVRDATRVVVIPISRVPDAAPAEAIVRLMAQFEPQAVIGGDVPTAEGFTGLTALNADKFGDGMDQTTIMVLSDEGELLILAGYDLTGDAEGLQTLLEEILAGLTAEDAPVILTDK